MRGYAGYLKAGVALLLLAVGCLGCGEELGPEHFPTTRVSGTIRVGGRPINGKGWVEFIPTDGTVGKLRSAPIRPDGSFEVDRVAVGWNQIGLVNVPIDPGLAGLFHPLSSSNPLRRRIAAQGSKIEIDLYQEFIQSQKAVTRQP